MPGLAFNLTVSDDTTAKTSKKPAEARSARHLSIGCRNHRLDRLPKPGQPIILVVEPQRIELIDRPFRRDAVRRKTWPQLQDRLEGTLFGVFVSLSDRPSIEHVLTS